MIRSYPIPCDPGHDVVYGLARGAGNEIYLAPSNEFTPGLCADVFAFDTATERFRQVIDVRSATGYDPASGLMPHSKVHLCLNSTSSGRLFAATHFTAPAVGQADFDAMAAYRGLYPGCFLLEYDPRGDRMVSHGQLLRGEGARISCLDERRHAFYFLSYPRCHLYRYDYEDRRLEDLGRTGQENAFGLEVDDEGNVFTSDDLGAILVYSPRSRRIEETGLHLPAPPGHGPNANYIRRMVRGMDGALYGFTNKGVRLFRLCPKERSLQDLGVIYGSDRPNSVSVVAGGRDPGAPEPIGYPNLPAAKALAYLEPHSLYIAFGGDGIYSDGIPVPNLVRFDLATREVTDLGKFICPSDGLPAWIPQCALSIPDARSIFFGLQQTVGRLRLWKFDLAASRAPAAPVPPEPLRRHVEAVRRQPFGASVEGSNPLPFVKRGHVVMHELGWRGEDRTIPAGEAAVSDLLFHSSGRLYGVTVGRRGHLFSFSPYAQNRFTENYDVHPWDLGHLGDEPILHARLVDDRRGNLLIAAQTEKRAWVRKFSAGSELKHYRGVFHSLPHWPAVSWDDDPFPLADALLPRPDATAAAMARDPAGGRMACGKDDGSIEILSSRGEKTSTAQIRQAWRIRALAWHPNGFLYGFAGPDDGIGEAFRVDPVSGRIDEIGILQVSSHPRYWMCHRCDAMAVGRRGEVYFAEHDRIAHVFVYVEEAAADAAPAG